MRWVFFAKSWVDLFLMGRILWPTFVILRIWFGKKYISDFELRDIFDFRERDLNGTAEDLKISCKITICNFNWSGSDWWRQYNFFGSDSCTMKWRHHHLNLTLVTPKIFFTFQNYWAKRSMCTILPLPLN